MKQIQSFRKSILAWNVSVAFAIQVTGYAVTFILNVLLARWLGAEQYGSFIFFKNGATIIGIFGTLGLFGTALKFISSYQAASRLDMLRGLIVFSTIITLIISTLLTLFAIVLIGIFPPGGINLTALLPYSPIIILIALHILYADILRGMNYIFEAIAPTDLIRPIVMLTIVLLMNVFFEFNLLEVTIFAFGISTILMILYQLAITALTLLRTKAAASRYQIREWLVFGFESLFFQGTIILRTEFTPVIIGYLLAGSDVGLFVVAERAGYVTAFLFNAVRRVFEPMIAPLYETGDLEELNRVHIRITRWTFRVTLLISIVIIAFSDFLLSLFGEEFIAARPLLIIILLGQLINAATGQAGSILRFAGYEKLVRNIMAISTALMLISTIILTAMIGIMGTAISISAGVIIQNIAFYLAMKRHLGLTLPLSTFRLPGSSQHHA